jgi:hypothetical protein
MRRPRKFQYSAHEHVVFDDDRQRASRFDHAANLCAGADVHTRADLRRIHERVRVDQRLLTNVRQY